MDEKLVQSLISAAKRILHRTDSIDEIDPAKPLWSYFPRNRGYTQAKETTEFCLWVADEYKVYLTEKEWQNPTAIQLAETIKRKQSDPSSMLREIKEVQLSSKKNLAWGCLFASGLGAMILFSAPPAPGMKLMGLLLFVFFNVAVVLIFLNEKIKFFKEIKPVLNHYKENL